MVCFFYLMLSPVKDTIVTNDRWCNNGCSCHHGGVFTCHDRYNPGESEWCAFLTCISATRGNVLSRSKVTPKWKGLPSGKIWITPLKETNVGSKGDQCGCDSGFIVPLKHSTYLKWKWRHFLILSANASRKILWWLNTFKFLSWTP